MNPEVQPLNGPSLADPQENPDPPQQEGGSGKVNRLEPVEPQEEVEVNPGVETPNEPTRADPPVIIDPPQEDNGSKGDRQEEVQPNRED